MRSWHAPDPLVATDQLARREQLVVEIAQSLASAGEYSIRIDLRPTQWVVDLNWAARQAARGLGIAVDVAMDLDRAREGRAQFRVTKTTAPA